MYLSRFPRSLPRVPLPSLQFDCQGTGGRESPKPGSGPQMRGGGGGGQTSLRLGYCCIWLSEPLTMVFINQLSPLLSSPPLPLFTVFAAWCRSTSRREMNWHSTKFSTRKLVSLSQISSKRIIRSERIRWNARDVVIELPVFSSIPHPHTVK